MEKTRKVKVLNRHGIHARVAAQIAQTALSFGSAFYISFNGKEVDGKNLLSILSLGASAGSELELRAVGEDSERLLDAMVRLFKSRFGEI